MDDWKAVADRIDMVARSMATKPNDVAAAERMAWLVFDNLATILSALRSTGTGRSEAEAIAHLLREAEPTLLRQSNDIILYCPDGTITDNIYDALERACYGRSDPSPPPARGRETDRG